MRSACYRIAWGLLFVLIDVGIEGVDVLPDALGYLIAASGLRKLGSVNVFFKVAHAAAWLLLVWSMGRIFLAPDEGALLAGQPPGLPGLSLHLAGVLLHTFFIYGICKGLEFRFGENKEGRIRERARICLGWFMALQTVWLVSYPFVLNVEMNTIVPWLIVVTVGVMITELAVVLLIRAAGRSWKERPTTPEAPRQIGMLG